MNAQVQITYGGFQGTGEGGDMDEGDQKVQASSYKATKYQACNVQHDDYS